MTTAPKRDNDSWRTCQPDVRDSTLMQSPRTFARAFPHILQRSGAENGHCAEARSRLLARMWPEFKREFASEAPNGVRACFPQYNAAIKARLLAKM